MTTWAYPDPLVEGVFFRRYKRFFADVRLLDGREVVAHCANTGAMTGVSEPGARCRVSPARNPKRKLRWSLEQIAIDGDWVMVHTARPNSVVRAAITRGLVPGLHGYATVRAERPYGDGHRIDLLLSDHAEGRADAYVEVKNVTLAVGREARFPDAVSVRGTRHLRALAEVVAQGHRGVLVPHVCRPDAERFAPAASVDPDWAEAFEEAVREGVEVVPLRVVCTPTGLCVTGTLPWHTAPIVR